MRTEEIDRIISQWEQNHGVVVSAALRRELMENFTPESQRECFAILDTMRQARPDEFSNRP
jgi:hypothetical protein